MRRRFAGIYTRHLKTKVGALFKIVLFALVLTTPSLWAQDGLMGAFSRLDSTTSLLRSPFDPRLIAADFDNDQKADGAVLRNAGQLGGQNIFRIELHVTARTDTDLMFASDESALAISSLDVNRDGTPDIIVEQPFTRKRLHVWLNDGHGIFRKVQSEDFPFANGKDSYQLGTPSEEQDFLTLYLPSKVGSDSAILTVTGFSLYSSSSGRHLRPIESAVQTEALAAPPARGPPFFISL